MTASPHSKFALIVAVLATGLFVRGGVRANFASRAQ
jgi:hypothetical protein